MVTEDNEALAALREYADRALAEFAKQGFKELVNLSGVSDAVAAVKPYKNRNAYILLCLVKKKLKLMGPSVDALITPLCLAQAGIGGKENIRQEIRERGAVCYVDKCMYGNALPEFCVVVSHYTADLICDAMNSDYECIWTHHLANGDPYDRYIYRKKGEKHDDIEDLGKTIKTVSGLNISPEDERELKDYVLVNVLDAVVEGFVDLHGEEKALEVLLPMVKKIGMEGGSSLVKENPGLKDNVAALGNLIDLFGQTTMQLGTVQHLSENEVMKEVTDCPFQTHPYVMCKMFEALLQGVVQSINPDLDYSYDRMMTKGDKICCWHLKLKGTATITIHEEKAEIMDPLAIIKMRLAKGEIDKREYEELRTIITA